MARKTEASEPMTSTYTPFVPLLFAWIGPWVVTAGSSSGGSMANIWFSTSTTGCATVISDSLEAMARTAGPLGDWIHASMPSSRLLLAVVSNSAATAAFAPRR